MGECWVCVIFFACVCVGELDLKTASDDPSSSALCVVCGGRFLGGSQVWLPLVTCSVQHWVVARGNAPNFFFGQFLLFLADL